MIQPLWACGLVTLIGALGSGSAAATAVRGNKLPRMPARAAGAGGVSTFAIASGPLSAAASAAGAVEGRWNGTIDAVCTWPPGFTFSVFTMTGRIGSVEPGDGRGFELMTAAGGSRRTGVLS